jgi:hypothetical protein
MLIAGSSCACSLLFPREGGPFCDCCGGRGRQGAPKHSLHWLVQGTPFPDLSCLVLNNWRHKTSAAHLRSAKRIQKPQQRTPPFRTQPHPNLQLRNAARADVCKACGIVEPVQPSCVRAARRCRRSNVDRRDRRVCTGMERQGADATVRTARPLLRPHPVQQPVLAVTRSLAPHRTAPHRQLNPPSLAAYSSRRAGPALPAARCLLRCCHRRLTIDRRPSRMGWRSWNTFGPLINHTIIEKNMAAITAKSWTVDGHAAKVSLADLGYIEFGLDEGWELCDRTQQPGRVQHDAQGEPSINSTRFPDLGSLVSDGKSKGLNMGWYLAGCACGETQVGDHD